MVAAAVPPTPLEISVLEEGLKVLWNDGHSSLYPFEYLRKKCPCVKCLPEEGQDPEPRKNEFTILPSNVPDRVFPNDIKTVGSYALQFFWNDGHDAGIYTFQFLRQLCPCSSCMRADPPELPHHKPPCSS